jgi:FKBP-type peptidyl-prolyl cis-trans isomerase SlyD
MTEETLAVSDGLLVSLDYTLRLDSDEVVDTSEGQEPLDFVQGQNQIVPGLEQALYGMEVGDEKDVVVEPDQGYGERDPEAKQVVPNDAFPEDVDLEPGMGLRIRDGAGRTTMAFVEELLPEGVKLDFNHPLAGETLHFHVKIANLQDAQSALGCGPCGGCGTSSATEGCC